MQVDETALCSILSRIGGDLSNVALDLSLTPSPDMLWLNLNCAIVWAVKKLRVYLAGLPQFMVDGPQASLTYPE